MKRKEMIEILRQSFVYWMNCPDSELTPCNDDEMYSRILADIEKAGMKPPTYYYDDCIGAYVEHEWEPEEINKDDKEWRNRYGAHDE